MSLNTQTIKVIIVDDHPLYCDGVQLSISKIKNTPIKVVGVAHNGLEALNLLKEVETDIILMDIQMPEMNGINATALITKQYPAVSVIALSSFNEMWTIADMIQAGAKGYMLKNTTKEELFLALQTVYEGDSYYSPQVTNNLKNIIQLQEEEKQHRQLSEREKEVVILMCEGKSNKEIAGQLKISKRTAEGHRNKILSKLNAKNSIDVVTYAVKYGIYKV